MSQSVTSTSSTSSTGNAPIRIAFLHASWHADIVGEARKSFETEIERLGVPVAGIEFIELPGAFEIPLHAKQLALTKRFDAVVACGFVVDGGIYRHDFVASAVISGLMSVQLETGVPMISVVLTPHHFHEHAEHLNFYHAHFKVKGEEAARACVNTVASLHRVAALSA